MDRLKDDSLFQKEGGAVHFGGKSTNARFKLQSLYKSINHTQLTPRQPTTIADTLSLLLLSGHTTLIGIFVVTHGHHQHRHKTDRLSISLSSPTVINISPMYTAVYAYVCNTEMW